MGVAGSGQRAREAVGREVDELETPALVLDVEIARANAALMGERIRGLSAELRPHIKAHKCAELAWIQLEHGAIGITAATVAEAEAMVRAGVGDVLIANQVVAPAATDRLVAAGREGNVTVAVDDLGNLEELARRARGAGTTLGVVVELDVGMGRGGARDADAALGLGHAAAGLAGVRLRGLLGYEGHCASEPDPGVRERKVLAAMDLLVGAAERFGAEGLPTEVVSAGATGTYETVGAIAGVTEVQAGSYILMDGFHEPLVSGFGFAVRVVATAISVHDDLVVFDAGRKAVGGDFGPPEAPGGPGTFAFLHEEHLGFRYAGGAPFRIGDRAALVPRYAPMAVNLFGAFYVAEAGRVVDVWPILARHGER
jgi:D-serine deaminase-like pyridoxal phosphate-dependent protein